jgi:hypothetical protein
MITLHKVWYWYRMFPPIHLIFTVFVLCYLSEIFDMPLLLCFILALLSLAFDLWFLYGRVIDYEDYEDYKNSKDKEFYNDEYFDINIPLWKRFWRVLYFMITCETRI